MFFHHLMMIDVLNVIELQKANDDTVGVVCWNDTCSCARCVFWVMLCFSGVYLSTWFVDNTTKRDHLKHTKAMG